MIPLSALEQYHEGADLRLFCSASAPPTGGRLQFEWRKDQAELFPVQQQQPAAGAAGATPQATSQQLARQLLFGGSGGEPVAAAAAARQQQSIGATAGANHNTPLAERLRISMVDESASVLRITQLEAGDTGNYTCLARNQHAFDSSTVRVNVMG